MNEDYARMVQVVMKKWLEELQNYKGCCAESGQIAAVMQDWNLPPHTK